MRFYPLGNPSRYPESRNGWFWFLFVPVLLSLACFLQSPTTPETGYVYQKTGIGLSQIQSFVPGQQYENVTAIQALNVRQHPGETEPVLFTLLSGTVVRVKSKCTEAGWVRISFDNTSGWVNADYLSGELCHE